MLRLINIALVLLLLNASAVFGESKVKYIEMEKQTLDQLLDPTKYDVRIRPAGGNGSDSGPDPAIIKTNMYIRNIEYVCTKKMEWKAQITFRQQWNDSRLTFDSKEGKIRYLALENSDRIWRPDTFFSNSRHTDWLKDLKPNTLVRIYPNGEVLFSARLLTTLSCPMSLKYYPFDRQTCSILMASYGYTKDDLMLMFKEADPVQITKTLNLAHFNLEKYTTSLCDSKTNTGEYSCIKVDFEFSRVTNHLVDWFLPTAVLTLVSFISFWLKPSKSLRIKFLIATLLIQYLHILYINSQSPVSAKGDHRTAQDCWTSTCLLFILLAFLEYAIVRGIDKLNKRNKCSNDSNDCKNNGKSINCEEGDAVALKPLVDDGQEKHTEENGKQYTVNEATNRRNYVQKWRQSSIGCRIDCLSAILFPILFIVYIITFFALNYKTN